MIDDIGGTVLPGVVAREQTCLRGVPGHVLGWFPHEGIQVFVCDAEIDLYGAKLVLMSGLDWN